MDYDAAGYVEEIFCKSIDHNTKGASPVQRADGTSTHFSQLKVRICLESNTKKALTGMQGTIKRVNVILKRVKRCRHYKLYVSVSNI